MTWFRAGGGGIPASLKNGMNAVLNKKFGTSGQTYAPSDWPDDVNLLGKLPEKTASGALVNILDGADDVPIKALSCSIVPQGGNGTPSSPVPITGTSKITLTHSKKNLFLPSNVDLSSMVVNGITREYTLDTQTFSFVGTNTKTDASWLIYAIPISDFVFNGLKSGITYRFLHNLPDVMYAQFTYNKSGGGIGAMGYLRGNESRNASVSFTLPSDFISLRNFQIGVSNTATDINITAAHFQIEVGSSASAYEAYDADTYDIDMPVGKNLWEFGDVTVSGTYVSNVLTTPLPAGTYNVSALLTSTYGSCDVRFRKEDGTAITSIYLAANTGSRVDKSVTLDEACYRIYLYANRGTGSDTATWEDIQIEAGSSATAYVPYKTVFGGTYEEDGTLTDEWGIIKYTGASNEYWVLSKTGEIFRFYVINDHVKRPTGRGIVYSNIGIYSATANDVGTCFSYYSSGINRVLLYYIPPQTIQTVEDFRTWLATNHLQICYEKATPTEVQIDPLPQINTHLGVNNFWTDVDGGETEVTYRADIDLALAQLSGTRGLMMASRSVSPMIGEEASLDRENILEEVSENSDNEESEEER